MSLTHHLWDAIRQADLPRIQRLLREADAANELVTSWPCDARVIDLACYMGKHRLRVKEHTATSVELEPIPAEGNES
jgi:hypothetical protein